MLTKNIPETEVYVFGTPPSFISIDKWIGRVSKSFSPRRQLLQLIHEADRDAGEISYLEMRSAIERVEDGESHRTVAVDTPNIGRSTIMSIYKNADRRA